MNTIRTEIKTTDGHDYVVSVSKEASDNEPTVCISDEEDGDVVVPLRVFRAMARIVDASA